MDLEFTKPSGFISAVTVPSGFTVSASSGARFVTDTDLFIPQGQVTGTVSATSVEVGTANNVQAGSISRIVQPLVGIASATNPLASTGGLDAESNSEMLSRAYALLRRRTLSTAEDFRIEVLTLLGSGANVAAYSGPDFGFPDQRFSVYIVGINSDESSLSPNQTAEIQSIISRKIQIGTEVIIQPVSIQTLEIRTTVTVRTNSATQDTATFLADIMRTYLSPTTLTIGADVVANEVLRRLYESARVVSVDEFTIGFSGDDPSTFIGCDGRLSMPGPGFVPQLRRMVITIQNQDSSFLFDIDV